MTRTQRPSGPASALRRAAAAVAAALVLTLLVVAPPAAALYLASSPDLIPMASSAAVAAGWLILLIGLGGEIVALARRRTVVGAESGDRRPVPRLGGPLQAVASWLVATVVAGFMVMPTPAQAAPAPEVVEDADDALPALAPGTPVAYSAAGAVEEEAGAVEVDTGDTEGDEDSDAEVDETDLTTRDITVAAGDTFWSLAEEELAEAWGRTPTADEVASYWESYIDVNRGRLRPPGDPDLIHPGQRFTVPTVPGTVTPASADEDDDNSDDNNRHDDDGRSDADDTDEDPGTPPEEPDESAADDADGNGRDSGGVEGADDRDNEDSRDNEDDHEESSPLEQEAANAGGPDGQEEGPPAGPDTSPSDNDDVVAFDDPAGADATDPGNETTAGGPGVGLPGAADTPSAPEPDASRTSNEREADDETVSSTSSLYMAGGLALAGGLLILRRRRRAQQRHRPRGDRPAGQLTRAEQELEDGADEEAMIRLDATMRAAAAGAGADGLPPVSWVEAGPQSTMLVLDTPVPPPDGFTVEQRGWFTSAPTDELEDLGAGAVAPAPTLVPVGATGSNSDALIELEASGLVVLDGPTEPVEDLLRALTIGVTTSPWSDEGTVLLVGLEGELTDLPGVSGTDLDEALARAEAHAATVAASLESRNLSTTTQGRAVDPGAPAWQPLVVVNALRPDDEAMIRRLRALAEQGHRGVAVITLSPTSATLPGRHLQVHDTATLRVDGVDEIIVPNLLDRTGAGSLVRLLDQAAARDDAAYTAVVPLRQASSQQADRSSSPPGAAPGGLDVLLEEADVLIRVLGEVEAVRGPGRPDEQKLVAPRHKALEVATYLAARQEPVTPDDLQRVIFPNGSRTAEQVAATVGSARQLLGEGLLRTSDDGSIQVADTVVTDYSLFAELAARAEETEDANRAALLLTEALELVRGEPFAGVGKMYSWVGPHRGTIVAEVVDAAEELADTRLALGDWRSAEWAARQGLKAMPTEERLHRLLMRSAHAGGQGEEGIRRIFRELSDLVADPVRGVEPEDTLHPETIELVTELVGTSRP